MNEKENYIVLILFCLLLSLIGIYLGNFALSLTFGGLACLVFYLMRHAELNPFSEFDKSPNSTVPPPKSQTELKLEKANEMRNNPTPAEGRMWEILNSSVIPNFPEHVFYPQSLQYGYILDFYCPTLNLAIEVDGGAHNNRRGYDWERDTHLAKWGIQVLRATNQEVFNNPQALANSLCKIIQEKNALQHSAKQEYRETKRYGRYGRYPYRRY